MSAANPNYVGLDMDSYYNSATPGGNTQTWVLMNNIKDLKRGSSMAEADLSVRDSSAGANAKLALKEPGLMEKTIEFDITTDESDAVYAYLRTAYETRAPVELALANGPIGTAGTVASGGTVNCVYLRIVLKIFGFDEDEPNEGGTFTHVTLKPCKQTQTNRPTRVTVA
jgi:hypothetical protein